tara:strand:+ start:654 stop:968 length:315 start_codon:yes stop_codon:yes gene_type:complete
MRFAKGCVKANRGFCLLRISITIRIEIGRIVSTPPHNNHACWVTNPRRYSPIKVIPKDENANVKRIVMIRFFQEYRKPANKFFVHPSQISENEVYILQEKISCR